MVPCLDDTEKPLTRALRGIKLSMAKQLVVLVQFVQPYSLFEQQLRHIQLPAVWFQLRERPNKGDAHRADIVTFGVCPLLVPAPALVHGTVSADQKVVANVAKILRFNVKILNVPHPEDTRTLEDF